MAHFDDCSEQFTVVRRGRRRGRRNQRRSLVPGGKNSVLLEEVPIERIDTIITNACASVELIKYSQQIIGLILESLQGCERLSTIWAIGIGSFNRSHYPGCDQLSVLIKLKEFFGCEVLFQEPCLTEQEKQWLCDHSICLSDTNDLLKCCVSSDNSTDTNVTVLFYAPHCGHAIYNSIIYAHRKELKNIIIIGNNFHTIDLNPNFAGDTTERRQQYVESSGKRIVREQNLEDSEHASSSELLALCTYSRICTSLEFPIFKSNFAAFNDTAVHFVPRNVSIPRIPDEKPVYQKFSHEIVF